MGVDMPMSVGSEELPKLRGVNKVAILLNQQWMLALRIMEGNQEGSTAHVCKDNTVRGVDIERLSFGVCRGSGGRVTD